MVNVHFADRPAIAVNLHTFRRRQLIPLDTGVLWQLKTGAVHTYTLSEEGGNITMGFWGMGDVVGEPLVRVSAYMVECLSDVHVQPFTVATCPDLHQVLLAHVHQAQEFLHIRSGAVAQRVERLLGWLMQKFGVPTEFGTMIELRLTHQEMADAVGSTRVSISRLLNQWEREGKVGLSRQSYLIVRQ
jgi:CRP-like cAMP-binding protein